MVNNRLTDEQVLALDKIMAEGNEKIIGLHFQSGYYGRGGSNSSPYTAEIDTDRTLEQLDGKPPVEMFGVYVYAIVKDVVYLVRQADRKVISFDAKGYYGDSYGVAYDTVESYAIRPIIKE